MNPPRDRTILAITAAGAVLGVIIGLGLGNARTFGAVGAMVGLVVGLALTVLPPRTGRRPTSPGRQQ